MWFERGSNVVRMWQRQQHQQQRQQQYRRCGSNVARMWFECGSNVVRMWIECVSNAVRMWQRQQRQQQSFVDVAGDRRPSLWPVGCPARSPSLVAVRRWKAGGPALRPRARLFCSNWAHPLRRPCVDILNVLRQRPAPGILPRASNRGHGSPTVRTNSNHFFEAFEPLASKKGR